MSRLFAMMNRLPSILLFLLLASISMPAQSVDTAIVGTVTDHSGAVISGAKVTVTSASTGIAKSAVTAGTGEYTINYLLPGSYDVAVTANGLPASWGKGVTRTNVPFGRTAPSCKTTTPSFTCPCKVIG